jgi:hypothetical protein
MRDKERITKPPCHHHHPSPIFPRAGRRARWRRRDPRILRDAALSKAILIGTDLSIADERPILPAGWGKVQLG